MSRPAVFLDRDGTLCREVGYVNHPSRLALAPGAAPALRRLSAGGYALVVVTNQAGIARGYFPPSVLRDTHRRLSRLLEREGVTLDGLYECLHHPDVGPPALRVRCRCRKPGPGLVERAAAELDLDVAASAMVGDTFKDVRCARAAGVGRAVLVRTGYGRGEILTHSHESDVWPDHVADGLPAAAAWILAGRPPSEDP